MSTGFPLEGLGFPSFSRISEKLCVVLHSDRVAFQSDIHNQSYIRKHWWYNIDMNIDLCRSAYQYKINSLWFRGIIHKSMATETCATCLRSSGKSWSIRQTKTVRSSCIKPPCGSAWSQACELPLRHEDKRKSQHMIHVTCNKVHTRWAKHLDAGIFRMSPRKRGWIRTSWSGSTTNPTCFPQEWFQQALGKDRLEAETVGKGFWIILVCTTIWLYRLYTDQSGSKSIHMVLECRCNNKFKSFFHQTIYIKLAQMIWIHKNLQGRIEQIHQLRLFCKPVSQSKEDRSQAARPFGRSQLTWPHPRVLRLQTFQTFEVYT